MQAYYTDIHGRSVWFYIFQGFLDEEKYIVLFDRRAEFYAV